MSVNSKRPYRHMAVVFNVNSADDDPDHVLKEYENLVGPDGRRRARIASGGFIFVDSFKNHVLLVQSVSTGELFVHKMMQPQLANEYDEPLELRISTSNPKLHPAQADRIGALPHDAPYFNTLRFWQNLKEADPTVDPYYALYFDFCNGGTLSDLRDLYRKHQKPVPESFIWLVAEQLSCAMAYLYFGARPEIGQGRQQGWTRLYHRDLNAHNVFLNYLPKRPGAVPAAGLETNALPEIVLGDFGYSGIHGDDLAKLPDNAEPMPPGQPMAQLVEWEDVYTLGRILRDLCMTHIPHVDDGYVDRRPDNMTLLDMMGRNDAPGYTAELRDMLGGFEWQDMETGTDLNDFQDPQAQTVADADWVLTTLLPAAQRRVAGYRSPGPGGRLPRGYWDAMDVSWTKPQTTMPFVYNSKYADEAGDDDDAPDPPSFQDERQQSERLRMGMLRAQHQWDEIRPYELHSLEYGFTEPRALHNQPPG